MSDERFSRDRNLTDRDILEALDREIAFYRGKLNSFSLYVIATQALVFTGQRTLSGADTLAGKILVSVFLAVLAVFAFLMRDSYKTRLYESRDERKVLVEEYGYKDLFHGSGGRMKSGMQSESPSFLWLCISWFLSIGVLVLIWLA